MGIMQTARADKASVGLAFDNNTLFDYASLPDFSILGFAAPADTVVAASGLVGVANVVGSIVAALPVSAVSGGTAYWIASLSDATIKADMTAASAGGVVSESGLVELFSDLVAKLTSGNAALSAAQYNDLKLIAGNLNVGETASSYLTYVTNALVMGNAANAKWTGGKATAVALGNLGAGASATQLSELESKWLQGTDLPLSTVQLSGSTAFNITSSAVANPLFGAGAAISVASVLGAAALAFAGRRA